MGFGNHSGIEVAEPDPSCSLMTMTIMAYSSGPFQSTFGWTERWIEPDETGNR